MSLQFLEPLELHKRENSFRLFVGVDTAAGARDSNVETEGKSVTATDIRAFRTDFKLDHHGFQPLTHKLNFNQWKDKIQAETVFLQDVAKLLLDSIEGSDRVLILD